jgi:large subunit ribosomal protein L31e
MAKKTENKEQNLERIYVIPLRREIEKVQRYRKTEKAVKAIKQFLARHMQIRDGDLKKIKLDNYLNEYMWARGIKNPPHKVKVKATKNSEGIVKVELVDFPTKLKFKKDREDKLLKDASEVAKKKKEEKKASEETEEKPKPEETEEKKEIEKEKKASVVEAGKELEKQAAKQMKHQAGGGKEKNQQSFHQARKALSR